MALPTAICPPAEPPSGSRVLTVSIRGHGFPPCPFILVDHVGTGQSPAPTQLLRRPMAVGSLEFLYRGGLGLADASSFDSGAQVVFAANGSAGHAPQYGDLAHMRQRVRNRALEQFLA